MAGPPRAFDWETVHRRLAEVAAAMERGLLEPSPEETRHILEARARRAARPPAPPDLSARLEVLAFSLGGETYGVETRHVREACQLKDLTPLPCTPTFIAGVMNLRGLVLPIVDLRAYFGLPARGLPELNRVVVLHGPTGRLLGLLADTVDGMRSIEVSDLRPGLPTLTGTRERFLAGVTSRMLTVLDGERLLDDPGLTIDEQVTT